MMDASKRKIVFFWGALIAVAGLILWLKLNPLWLFILLMIACHMSHSFMGGHGKKHH